MGNGFQETMNNLACHRQKRFVNIVGRNIILLGISGHDKSFVPSHARIRRHTIGTGIPGTSGVLKEDTPDR